MGKLFSKRAAILGFKNDDLQKKSLPSIWMEMHQFKLRIDCVVALSMAVIVFDSCGHPYHIKLDIWKSLQVLAGHSLPTPAIAFKVWP